MKRQLRPLAVLLAVLCLFTGCVSSARQKSAEALVDKYLSALKALDYGTANSLITPADSTIACELSPSAENDAVLPLILRWEVWSVKAGADGALTAEVTVKQKNLKAVYTAAMEDYTAYMLAAKESEVTESALEEKWTSLYLAHLKECTDYVTLKAFVDIRDGKLCMTKDFMNILFGGEPDAIDRLLANS